MNGRRVLTASPDKAQVQKRYDDYYKEHVPGSRVEPLDGQWAVTAAKKKEGR